jgi:hypothetical protein
MFHGFGIVLTGEFTVDHNKADDRKHGCRDGKKKNVGVLEDFKKPLWNENNADVFSIFLKLFRPENKRLKTDPFYSFDSLRSPMVGGRRPIKPLGALRPQWAKVPKVEKVKSH